MARAGAAARDPKAERQLGVLTSAPGLADRERSGARQGNTARFPENGGIRGVNAAIAAIGISNVALLCWNPPVAWSIVPFELSLRR
jgi:hypothetical protein